MHFSDYLIVSDLDGTFLGNGKLVPRNVEALRRFRDGGGMFTVATGRAHLNLRSAIGDPLQHVNAPAVICDNGAYLHDYASGTSFAKDLLLPHDAAELLEFTLREFPDVRFSASAVSCIRSAENAGLVALDMATYDPEAVEIRPVEEWPLDDWYKLLFFDTNERLQQVYTAVQKRFGERMIPTFSNTWILEVQYPGIHKALGLQKLKKCLDGAGKRKIIACGDFDNDINMLREADVAVCPANAVDAVKAVSDHVLCHCTEGLIANVIEAIEQGSI
ncbi:MAG: HAD family phosphatase [Ruminococcaceae bacterium]|nr:HAD family phosphatase [Oscillospiraceae bacterium]